MNKLTEEERKEICEKYQGGITTIDIQKEYNIHPRTLYQTLKRENINVDRIKYSTLTDTQITEICNKYQNGVKNKDLALEYNVKRYIIRYYLKKNNIELRIRLINKLTKDQKNDICEKYETGLNTMKLAPLFKTSQSNISVILKKRNIQMRPSIGNLQYNINKYYFDIIDTHEKAYFFGLLLGDGSNKVDRYTIALSLQEKDKEILDKFKIALETNKPLYYSKLNEKNPNWSNQYRLAITNKHMSEKLAELGMIQNKTYGVQFPKWLNKKFYNSFILGVFDADGCIHIPNKTGHSPTFSITGNQDLLIGIQDVLISELGLSKTKFSKRWKERDNDITTLAYCGCLQCIKIRDYLYKDSPIFLTRKHDKFFSLKENK